MDRRLAGRCSKPVSFWFCRALPDARGTTPQRYLQRYRFSKAVQLLQNSDARIYDIARRVGYDSKSSFSEAFKRPMGKAPGAYR